MAQKRLHAEGAIAIAAFDSEFYAGSPAILCNRWKRGSTCYVGARLDEKSLVSFYRFLSSDLDLPSENLPQGVVRKIRLGSEGPVEFLFNYNRCEVVLDLGDESFVRISDGFEVTAKTTLQPYETLLRGIAVDVPNVHSLKSYHTNKQTPHEPPIPS